MIKVEGLPRCFGDLVVVDHLDRKIFAEEVLGFLLYELTATPLPGRQWVASLSPMLSGSSWYFWGSSCSTLACAPSAAAKSLPGGETLRHCSLQKIFC